MRLTLTVTMLATGVMEAMNFVHFISRLSARSLRKYAHSRYAFSSSRRLKMGQLVKLLNKYQPVTSLVIRTMSM